MRYKISFGSRRGRVTELRRVISLGKASHLNKAFQASVISMHDIKKVPPNFFSSNGDEEFLGIQRKFVDLVTKSQGIPLVMSGSGLCNEQTQLLESMQFITLDNYSVA